MDHLYSGDLLCSQEGVHPVPRPGRREWGGGHGRCPVGVGGDDPVDPLRVPAGRDNEEEQGGAQALLPEDLPSLVGTPGPGEGGGKVRAGPVVGRVRGRSEGGTPGGLSGERLVHDSLRGGRPGGRGRAGVSTALSTNTVISPTFKCSSCACRRWSAASSLETPPGYVARAWFRYGAVSPGQGVQQGWSVAVQGRGGPCARQPQGVPHGQGPA